MDGELVAAEVRLRRAGGDDQAVVAELPGPVEQGALDDAALEVDAADLGEDDLRVALVAEDVPERRRDVPLRQHSRRDLVEQRLKEVMRLPVDHGHVDRHPRNAFAAARPPKPPPTITTRWRAVIGSAAP